MWDVKSGKQICFLNDQRHPCFDPDGKTLATASRKRRLVNLWNTENWKKISEFRFYEDWVDNIELKPGAIYTASVSEGKDRIIQNAENGKKIVTLQHYRDSLTGISKSPNGRYLVTVSQLENTARLWDAKSGDEVHQLSHQYPFKAACFSPDSRRVATLSDWIVSHKPVVVLWDIETGNDLLLIEMNDFKPDTISFSPDGMNIIVSSEDEMPKMQILSAVPSYLKNKAQLESWRNEQYTTYLERHGKQLLPICELLSAVKPKKESISESSE